MNAAATLRWAIRGIYRLRPPRARSDDVTMPESPGVPGSRSLDSETPSVDPASYFIFEGGATGQVYFYGFDGGCLGTMQPPGFP
jgi:hypothetical protein